MDTVGLSAGLRDCATAKEAEEWRKALGDVSLAASKLPHAVSEARGETP